MRKTGTPINWPGVLALGLMLTVLAAGTWAFGQTAVPLDQQAETPLHITAAQLEADQDKNLIIFKGQVKAVYGDATLYTDKLLVFFKKPEKKAPPAPAAQKTLETSPLGQLGGEKLDRIEALGNVRFVQEDRVATGEKAIYYQDKDEVVLLGRPQVWRGENNLKGNKIIFNLTTKRVVVESSPKRRVEAHLYQTVKGAKTTKDLFPGTKPAGSKPGRSR